MRKALSMGLLALGLLALTGCSAESEKSRDVTANIRTALDQAGLQSVSVSQDREKGVVTLTGDVKSDDQKSQAESIAKSAAGSMVVADQIAVRPPGDESTAKKVDSDVDDAIGKNLDAALLKTKLKKDVKYDVKNGVVTLTGDVHSASQRNMAQEVAKKVPNVTQVVNEIEVKGRKATSSE